MGFTPKNFSEFISIHSVRKSPIVVNNVHFSYTNTNTHNEGKNYERLYDRESIEMHLVMFWIRCERHNSLCDVILLPHDFMRVVIVV